ncbi:hypothetical protein ILUMI_12472 [Ignelater luminosus]|uniref:PWWP domain-containing protein n=1 Tax=Ignelater luminosus TaxID=2038154 RepID=A0A8K0GBR9_IGNLU|nr:hypothetical protein ILUMI_12472 [Ignelater luminosus]
MKKNKGFKVGDKVFAKVKGYPAWPAIITEDKNNKYDVKFYGTGETGTVKAKDLFYYLQHKEKYVKSLKRKDYNEAVEEIEKAIQDAGTDGNDDDGEVSLDSVVSSNTSVNNNSSAKSTKRKRSASVSVDKISDTQVKKKAPSRSRTPHPSEIIVNSFEETEKKEENGNSETNSYDDENTHLGKSSKARNNNAKEQDINSKLKYKSIEESEGINDIERNTDEDEAAIDKSKQNVPKSTYNIDDVHIITTDFLQGLITYAEYVKQKEEIYNKMPVEDRKKDKVELLIVKQPEGKLVGIKFNYETPPPLNNELDYAQYEESKAKTILSFKTLVEQGSSQPEDEPHMFVTNLNFDIDEVTNAVELDLIKRKREKVLWLKTESNLIELDAKIKSNLGLDRADPKQALEHLDKMLRLQIEPLMLKKHPPVVDMVKRLCRYIGNVKEWNLNDDQLEAFEFDAARVRNKAADVYLKFSSIFDVEDETKFWDFFSELVDTFKEKIKDMSESYVYALTAEPYSRRAFFDAMDEAEEMKIILSKMEKNTKSNKTEKENSNKTANSENNDEQVNVVENSNPIS